MSLDEIAHALDTHIGRLAQLAFAGFVGAITYVAFRPADTPMTAWARGIAVLTGLGFAIYIVPSAVTYFSGVNIMQAERSVFQWGCAACYLGGMVGNNLIPTILEKAPKALGSAIDRFFNRGGGA